jgi:hypothetical protein
MPKAQRPRSLSGVQREQQRVNLGTPNLHVRRYVTGKGSDQPLDGGTMLFLLLFEGELETEVRRRLCGS